MNLEVIAGQAQRERAGHLRARREPFLGRAEARTRPLPAGMATLCTGTGPVMVHVDKDGQPVGPPVLCPDFALSLLQAVALQPVLPAPPGLWHRWRPEAAPARSAPSEVILSSVRDPPRAA